MKNMCFRTVCALVVTAMSSFATEYWVATTGSDLPGTVGDSSDPFLTLTNALAHASANDTIWVRPGTYPVTQNGNKDTPWAVINKAVTVISEAGPETTFFDGNNAADVFPFKMTSSGAVFAGFTLKRIKSNSTWNNNYGGIIDDRGGATISNCVFSSCSSYYTGTIRTAGGKIVDCVFNNCSASDSNSFGGGVAVMSGSTVVERCVFKGCSARRGSAVYMEASGAVVRDCIMLNCTSSGSRGIPGTVVMTAGLLDRCIITNNTASLTGGSFATAGGVYLGGGTVRNSLVAGNSATSAYSAGGGIYQAGASSTIENCTVTGNKLGSIGQAGQGVYQSGGTIKNSIIAFNGFSGVFAESSNFECHGTVTYSCTYPEVTGEGNISKDPMFSNTASWPGFPSELSPCINAGLTSAWAVAEGAVDLAGARRVLDDYIDMGAFEIDKSQVAFTCQIQLVTVRGVAPIRIDFETAYVGAPGPIDSATWDFGDGTIVVGPPATNHVYAAPGTYTVGLVLRSGGSQAECTIPDAIQIGPAQTYVAPGSDGVWPYDEPAKATSNLLAAIDAFVFPDDLTALRVHVAPGRYFIPPTSGVSTPWIKLDMPVEIIADEGPETTFFDGGWSGTGTGPNRYFAFLNNKKSILSGVTVENIYSSVDYTLYQSGAIHLAKGVVTNCVIRNNNFFFAGPVSVVSGTLVDCVVSNNVSRDGWTCGGVSIRNGSGRVLNSLICGNTGKEGPGIFVQGDSAIVSNCVIRGNVCAFTTRGSFGCNVISGGLVTDCVISNNVGYLGGGVTISGGTLRNSLVVGNEDIGASSGGGGIRLTGGTVDGCTVAGNSCQQLTSRYGVYMTAGTLRNTIVARNGNASLFEDSGNFVKTGGTATYCCTYPAAEGTGNIDSDPHFVAVADCDYRLMPDSPCIDTGLQQGWMTGVDAKGGPRVIGAAPDIGCFEYNPDDAPFSCGIDCSTPLGVVPFEVTFEAGIFKAPGPIDSISWDFGDGSSGSGAEVSHTYSVPGRYSVTLTVRSAGETATKTEPDIITAGATNAYVSTTGASIWPYDTPARAATNIQDAVDAIVLIGDSSVGRVHVAPGVYKLRTYGNSSEILVPEISLVRPIEIISDEGPATTIIDGGGKSSQRTRGIRIGHQSASLRGFTVRGVQSAISDKNSAGTLQMSAGMVSDCSFTNNVGSWCAIAAISGGTIADCFFANNNSSDSAGEGGALRVTGGLVRNCIFERNRAVYGEAIWVNGSKAVVSNCVIRNNTAYSKAARGIGGAAVELCNGIVVNCVITNNVGTTAGGVVTQNDYITGSIPNAAPILRNCLVARNKAEGYGTSAKGAGGVYHGCGTVENCTIADNAPIGSCAIGGILAEVKKGSPAIRNVIVWGNGGTSHQISNDVSVETSSLNVDPKFKQGGYRLDLSSPCRDAGTLQNWMTGAVDLDGTRRIFSRAVDLGCYELVVAHTMLILQ